jgi:ribonuclease G
MITHKYSNDEELYNQTKDYLQEIAPSKNQSLSFINQMILLFEKYNIETKSKLLWKTVSMSKGAYLIIEHTEALRHRRKQRKPF